MANLTPQHKVWTNIVVLGDALNDHHCITFPARIPIRKSGIYSALMLGGCTGEVLHPTLVLGLQLDCMILRVFSSLNNRMILWAPLPHTSLAHHLLLMIRGTILSAGSLLWPLLSFSISSCYVKNRYYILKSLEDLCFVLIKNHALFNHVLCDICLLLLRSYDNTIQNPYFSTVFPHQGISLYSLWFSCSCLMLGQLGALAEMVTHLYLWNIKQTGLVCKWVKNLDHI